MAKKDVPGESRSPQHPLEQIGRLPPHSKECVPGSHRGGYQPQEIEERDRMLEPEAFGSAEVAQPFEEVVFDVPAEVRGLPEFCPLEGEEGREDPGGHSLLAGSCGVVFLQRLRETGTRSKLSAGCLKGNTAVRNPSLLHCVGDRLSKAGVGNRRKRL